MSGSGVHGGPLPEEMTQCRLYHTSPTAVWREFICLHPLSFRPIFWAPLSTAWAVPWFYHLVEGASECLKSVSPGMLVCPMSVSKPLSQPIENWEPPSSLVQGTGRFQSTEDKLQSSIPGGYKLSVLWKVTPPPNVVMGQWPSVCGYFLSGTLAWSYRICPFRGLERKYAM